MSSMNRDRASTGAKSVGSATKSASASSSSSDAILSWNVCEVRLLDRLLYKQKNQHRKTEYYHKLIEVRNATRQLWQEFIKCGATATKQIKNKTLELDQEDEANEVSELLELNLSTLVHDRTLPGLRNLESLCHALVHSQRVILKASRLLYGLLGQTYFMSFALTMLAILARMYATQRTTLLATLNVCIQARITSKSSTSSTILAESLYRAMRSDEEREWIEKCDGSDLFVEHDITSHDPSSTSATSTNTSAIDLASTSEGDSDEDEDTAVSLVTPAKVSLPSQLAFFSSAKKPMDASRKSLSSSSSSPSSTPVSKVVATKSTPTTKPTSTKVAAPPTPSSFQTPLKASTHTTLKSSPIPVELSDDDEILDNDEEDETMADVDVDADLNDSKDESENESTPAKSSKSIKSISLPAKSASAQLPKSNAKQSLDKKKLSTAPGKLLNKVAIPSSPNMPSSKPSTSTLVGTKRKQPDATPSATLSSQSTATKSPKSTTDQQHVKQKSKLVGDPFGAISALGTAKSSTSPSLTIPSHSPAPSILHPKKPDQLPPTPLELLTRGLQSSSNPPASSSSSMKSNTVISNKKKMKKKVKSANDADEMDDIFG